MSEEAAAHINAIATQLATAVGRMPSDIEIQTLSSLLIAVASDKVRAAQIQERIRLDNGLRTLVESLASTEVRTQGILFNFGDGNKTGDITIGDFVGGDKITISLTLNVPEQSYLTGGLLNPFLGLRPFTYADRAAYGGQVTCFC